MMIGCLAEAAGRDITLDDEELEEARWISREDVRRAMTGDGPIGVPPRMAIAHQLMKAFADGAN